MIERLAYAKINLFLDVKGIRKDGYHNIVSVMQTVDWADTITLDKTEASGIVLTCSDQAIPTDKSNTVYKATKMFLSRLQMDGVGVRVHIEKRIPSAAGLAGGSADAAATLSGLNDLFDTPFSVEELLDMGRQIGADVPFCLVGGTKMIGGIGEVIDPFPSMPSCYLVCAKLGEGVSTPQAYRMLDEQYNCFPIDSVKYGRLSCLRESFKQGTLSHLSEGLYNIFEEPIEKTRPSISRIKNTLVSFGADVAMMSGSGPSVFGIFQNGEDATQALEALRRLGAVCEICKPIEYGGEQ